MSSSISFASSFAWLIAAVTGANTIATTSGGVNIDAGTLKPRNATALSAGVLLALGGGTLDLNENSVTAGSFGGGGLHR